MSVVRIRVSAQPSPMAKQVRDLMDRGYARARKAGKTQNFAESGLKKSFSGVMLSYIGEYKYPGGGRIRARTGLPLPIRRGANRGNMVYSGEGI